MTQEIGEALGHIGLIPVITIEKPEDAVPLAHALLAGGIQCAEITFRTNAAAESIHCIVQEVPTMLVGAGTVLTIPQAEQALAAGAHFIVAPGFDPVIVNWCQEHDIFVIPGVATATEISLALSRGIRLLKFFPAEELGGVRMLKALYGPFRDVQFVPTGGINASNLHTYLALPNVAACGGSWIATSQLLSKGHFDEITRLSKEAQKIVCQEHKEREAAQ
jgi:2-dehydro-3-deoxyphosphogluconate aldolase/(4S)-4-hydroxy-2-oxoglutarate aldolase